MHRVAYAADAVVKTLIVLDRDLKIRFGLFEQKPPDGQKAVQKVFAVIIREAEFFFQSCPATC